MTYGCSALQFVGPHVVESTTGVQQGDPLSPCFSHSPYNPLSTTSTAIVQKCTRDGILMMAPSLAPYAVVQHAVQMVVDRAPAFGLSLNPQKCRVWAPVHNPLHIQGFPLGFTHEHRAGLTVLGAAITVSVEYAVFCGTGSGRFCGCLAGTLIGPPPSSSRAPLAKELPRCMQSSIHSSVHAARSSCASFYCL
jgi:hypothetical protein